SGQDDVFVTLSGTNLVVGTNYFRIVAQNEAGVARGDILRFTISPFAQMSSFGGLGYSSVAWIDFDGDGKLDLIAIGEDVDSISQAKLWRNTGNSFEETTNSFTGVWAGSIAVADFDNDGLPDVLIAGAQDYYGWNATQPLTQLWRNTGHGFTNV